MRMLISEWLTGEGHAVRSLPRHDAATPASSTTASTAFSDADVDATVDLVILDLPHPRSRSADTARAVQAVHAACPRSSVIGMSTQFARSLGRDSEVTRALGVSRLLAKPCTREELLGAVAAALAA